MIVFVAAVLWWTVLICAIGGALVLGASIALAIQDRR